jgi:hypothetical protein
MEKYPSNGTLTRIDNKLKGHLRAAPAARAHGSIQEKSNPIEPVNRLFGTLMQRFVSDLPKGNLVLPKGVRASDWDFKRHRAQRFLKWKKKTDLARGLLRELYRALGRGARLYGSCHTFLIRGFRINGRRIIRA